jgi:hypothetical protein
MEPEPQMEMSSDDQVCPECGAEEAGYFCRNCGALVRGRDMVLCPRCHHVVPTGEFCNKCGQTTVGLALNLRQLAMAGEEFWVTSAASASGGSAPDDLAWGTLEPDDSVDLAEADLPDWLDELPADAAPPDVKAHVYPSLVPIEDSSRPPRRSPLVVLAMMVLGLLLLALVAFVVYLLFNGSL